jgi:hypothetical protein
VIAVAVGQYGEVELRQIRTFRFRIPGEDVGIIASVE